MTATNTNNRVRKTLASQLDRLDGILDALGEGLNQAITDGVKTAVGVAVKQAITDVLTNEELLQHLRGPGEQASPPLPSSPPSVPSTSGGWLGGLWAWVRDVAERAWDTAKCVACATWNWVSGTAQQVGELAKAGVEQVRRGACALYMWLLSRRVAHVVGIAGLVGVVWYFSGPGLAAAAGSLTLPALLTDLPAYVLSLFGGG